jgi:hypothetical protein
MRARVLSRACQKPKELRYSYELWTYVRKHCLDAGHPSLTGLSHSKLHRILPQGEIRRHKIRYYVERRHPEFERKMVEVLHVYKDVEIVNAAPVGRWRPAAAGFWRRISIAVSDRRPPRTGSYVRDFPILPTMPPWPGVS